MSPSHGEDLLDGRYKLAGALGSGGMAEVYRAWDTVLCRDVAVKLFAPSADLDDRRRFVNEVRTLASLSHPGLVSVYDTGGSDRGAFLVLQLVDGHAAHPVHWRSRRCGGWEPVWPRHWPTCTTGASCTGTSNRRTSCSTAAAGPIWRTSGWLT